MRNRAGVMVLLAGGALLGVVTGVRGQSVTTGAVNGRVVDATGQALSEALVTLTTPEGGRQVVQATMAGTFSLPDLTPGSVSLLVEKVGYSPVRLEGVAVLPGEVRDVVITLPASGAGGASTVRYGAGSGSAPGFTEWLGGSRLRAYAGADRWAGARAAELSPALAGGRIAEGLPGRLSTTFVDGVPLELPPGEPSADGPAFGPIGLSSAAGAELLLDPGDVEWGGFSAAALSLLTRRGGERTSGSVLATWSGQGLVSPDLGGLAHTQGSEAQGALAVGGPIVADTSFYFLAIDARRLNAPYADWPQAGASLQALTQAASGWGVDLAPYAAAHLRTSTAVSGSGTLSWRLSKTSRLSMLGLVAVSPEVDTWRGGALVPATREALAVGTLASQLGLTWQSEARLWYENARLSRAAVGGFSPDSMLPLTQVADAGVGFGALAGGERSLSVQVIGARETLSANLDRSHVKLGVEAVLPSFQRDAGAVAARAFSFGSAADLAVGQGLLEVTNGPASQVSLSIPRFALFAQDTWTPAPGIQLLFGLRADGDAPSASGVAADTGWLKLSGVKAPTMPGAAWTVSPRVSFRWSPGNDHAWTVRAGAGLYAGHMNGALLGSVLAEDGRTTLAPQLGAVGAWPQGVTSGGTPQPVLSTVASAYRPPVTTRATVALAHDIGPVDVAVGLIYRRTEFLPTWRDLNLLDVQTGQDSNGRPLYGTLAKEGGLVLAEPGSNRRFPTYGPVYALESTATSRYLGGQVAVRVRLGAGELFAAYTRSRTRDNWLGAAAGQPAAGLVPLAGTAGTSWADGTSDFDLPDLAVAGGRLGGDVGTVRVTATAAYHYRSGLPFTPGFGPGIDANADGSALNDPAFVDPNVSGMQALLGRWPCLRQDQGHLASRNSCRDPATSGLDLELTAGLGRPVGLRAEFVLDAVNLIASGQGIYDHALVLVDQAAPLGADSNGRVTVPVVANPDFGTLRVRLAPPRVFRIGLRIRY